MNMMILLIAGIIALVAILLMGLLFVFWIWPMIRRSQAKSSGEAAEAVIQSAQNPSRGINSDENRE
jgi:predicted lipid-binding transport protein (Tim44 family)